ncbi:MAG TPA: hypothetical protein VFO10_26275 [Oligoflexus sp.]|uniref:hypothetical protein n=1 Tax=Oligoflexus sp. TaxID=1971216 RepID=UPI002D7E4277|nr:hypothetical protein [Oligoflexus sp.]HET9240799.1 hypothetical protein [Oligoflexus sp.]
MFKLHFKKIALILSLGGMTGTGHALEYCRAVASNEEGYGPIVLREGQPLRQSKEGGSQYCVATRSCQEALNGEGYGHPFWSSSKLYRKVDQDWSNSNASNWCLVHSSLDKPELDLFEHKGQKIFLTGVNLGNVQFLPFRNAPYSHSEAELKEMLRKAFADLKATGANSFRFWLHIDGSRSPSFTNGQVSGLPAGLIEDLQWLIQTAYRDYGLLANITLWSHDVLAVRREHQVASRDQVVRMIEDEKAMQAYIQNALTPMLQAMQKKMPGSTQTYNDGVMSWEVFNEPEGVSAFWRLYWNYQYGMEYGEYSWRRVSLSYLDDRRRTEFAVDDGSDSYTPVRYRGWHFVGTQNTGFNSYMYKDVTDDYPSEWDYLKKAIVDDKTLQTVEIPHEKVLKFINRIAGTIHRVVPDAKVSTGTHSMPYNTDVEMEGLGYENAPFNYYTDERLIAAGGDPLGTLDFYQVHGYPEWSDVDKDGVLNMFKYPKKHWKLNKPLIVGEHWNIIGAGNEMLQPFHYQHLHDTGYAGVWGWAYFYVREKVVGGQPQRSIDKHENQDYFRNVQKGLPGRLKYSVSGR